MEAVAGVTEVSSRPVLLVHEDVDVLADRAALVEDPAPSVRVLALERLQHLGDGRALELELALSPASSESGALSLTTGTRRS